MSYDVIDVDPDLYVDAGSSARLAASEIRTAVNMTALTEIPQFCSLKFPTPGRFRS